MPARDLRLNPFQGGKMPERLFQQVFFVVDVGQGEMGLNMVRFDLKGLPVGTDRGGGAAFLLFQITQGVSGPGFFSSPGKGFPETFTGGRGIPRSRQSIPSK